MLLKYLNETPIDMEITPDIAALFLEHNYYDQRRKRPNEIARYANDMKNGRWHEYISHYQDPIIFNREGFMINGQNRFFYPMGEEFFWIKNFAEMVASNVHNDENCTLTIDKDYRV